MKTNTGHDRRFIIAKNLIMMLVVLVVGLLAVWSWFSFHKKVSANDISVKAASPNEIGLAKPRYNSDGVDQGPDKFEGEINFESNTKLDKDCTGDGETLLVPSFSITKDKETAIIKGKEVNVGGSWEEALSQDDVDRIKRKNPESSVEARYIEHVFYARSLTKSVMLSSNSYLTNSSDTNSEKLTSNYSSNKASSYGNFSSDCLLGAVRVAFVVQPVNVTQTIENSQIIASTVSDEYQVGSQTKHFSYELSCLWLPRPDLKLNITEQNGSTIWSVTRNITDASHGTYSHSFYKPKNTDNTPTTYIGKYSETSSEININKKKGSVVERDNMNSNAKFLVTPSTSVESSQNTYPTLGTDKAITGNGTDSYLQSQSWLSKSGNGIDDESWYYVFRVKLRMWLEGEDAESRRAMDGGQFMLHLELV